MPKQPKSWKEQRDKMRKARRESAPFIMSLAESELTDRATDGLAYSDYTAGEIVAMNRKYFAGVAMMEYAPVLLEVIEGMVADHAGLGSVPLYVRQARNLLRFIAKRQTETDLELREILGQKAEDV